MPLDQAPDVVPQSSMAELLGAFAFANDLAFGLELDDSARSCYLAIRIGERLELPAEERAVIYYAALLKDAGCTSWTSAFASFWKGDEIEARRDLLLFGAGESLPSFVGWMLRYVAPELPPARRARQMLRVLRHQPAVLREGFAATREVAMRIAERLGMPPEIQDVVCGSFEHWDGNGLPDGLAGEEIPRASRVIHPTFTLAPTHRRYGRAAVVDLARSQRGKAFEPAVADAFLSLAEEESFWAELERSDVWDLVVAAEPPGALGRVDEARIDAVALAFADFTDLKSPYVHAHSRRTAELAEALARALDCEERTVVDVRRSALVHDLGLVAVPSSTLAKSEEQMTAGERERLHLHPYHVERILSRVPPLAAVAGIASLHHERLDGGGYFRRLPAPQIPLATRILAVASRYDELTHDAPGRAALPPHRAIEALTAESGSAYAPDVVRALPGAAGVDAPRGRRSAWPAGLTDREVEVLRLAARGLTRRHISEHLTLSENTVRHHLEHIYNKTGASTRVGAVLFAIEQGLIE